MAAVLLDTVTDAAAAASVAVAGAIILAADGLFCPDPAVTLTIAVVVGWHAVKLTRKMLARRSPKAAQSACVSPGTQLAQTKALAEPRHRRRPRDGLAGQHCRAGIDRGAVRVE